MLSGQTGYTSIKQFSRYCPVPAPYKTLRDLESLSSPSSFPCPTKICSSSILRDRTCFIPIQSHSFSSLSFLRQASTFPDFYWICLPDLQGAEKYGETHLGLVSTGGNRVVQGCSVLGRWRVQLLRVVGQDTRKQWGKNNFSASATSFLLTSPPFGSSSSCSRGT